MEEKKTLEERLESLERIVRGLAHYIADMDGHANTQQPQEPPMPKQEEINLDDFARLYNVVKYNIPITTRFAPLVINMNSKYKNSLIEKALCPSGYGDFYQPKGELSPLFINFKDDLKYDYSVDCVFEGFFEWDRPVQSSV